MNPYLRVVDYQPHHQPYFERFNKAWIEKYFKLEPVDIEVLENPDEHIIKPGGVILVAEYERIPCGVVALKKMEDGVFEMTKMAVTDQFKGRKIGLALGEGILKKAQDLQAKKVILYSQVGLSAAVIMYRKLGFHEMQLLDGKYSRCDIMMEFDFDKAQYLEQQSLKLRKVVDNFLTKSQRLGVDWNYKKEFRKWSKKEIIGHLIDSVQNNHQRFMLVQFQPELRYPEYDQDFWVNTHNYHHLPTDLLLENWKQQNYLLAALIKQLRFDSLDKQCYIGDAPAVSVRYLIENYIEHLEHHLKQII